MSRILVLVEHAENRRLLVEWLALYHEVIVPDEEPPRLDTPFDLVIVDESSLDRRSRWIDAVKASAHPVFLPFLLVANRHGARQRWAEAWTRIDELIVTPAEKFEMHARVENLLRARRLSLTNASLRQRLERELARAREVQARLLPRESPSLSAFELAARCLPAREVGGDFFDWESLDGSAVLSVGDVMGKGIPAALLAATVRAVLRALARQNAPGVALDLLREALTHDLERTASFVTLLHARVCGVSGEVRYVDAGHGHALVRRASGALERLERGGRPIGFPAVAAYREGRLRLMPGDALLVYSDGLVGDLGALPDELLAEIDPDASAAAIVDRILAQVPTDDAMDDVTLLVLKSRAGATSSALASA